MSYHSLEDRKVKQLFQNSSKLNNNWKVITKKAILPSEKEIEYNRRSRSVKVRIGERTNT
jgi:16S rRNA (cytosine1402-N4)-methyltransferase